MPEEIIRPSDIPLELKITVLWTKCPRCGKPMTEVSFDEYACIPCNSPIFAIEMPGDIQSGDYPFIGMDGKVMAMLRYEIVPAERSKGG